MRKYFLEDPLHPKGGITVECKDDHDCVFCERCTDVWWDYTNLIYMIACADDHDPWDRPCKWWSDWGNGTGSCELSEAAMRREDATDFCSFGERRDDEIDRR